MLNRYGAFVHDYVYVQVHVHDEGALSFATVTI